MKITIQPINFTRESLKSTPSDQILSQLQLLNDNMCTYLRIPISEISSILPLPNIKHTLLCYFHNRPLFNKIVFDEGWKREYYSDVLQSLDKKTTLLLVMLADHVYDCVDILFLFNVCECLLQPLEGYVESDDLEVIDLLFSFIFTFLSKDSTVLKNGARDLFAYYAKKTDEICGNEGDSIFFVLLMTALSKLSTDAYSLKDALLIVRGCKTSKCARMCILIISLYWSKETFACGIDSSDKIVDGTGIIEIIHSLHKDPTLSIDDERLSILESFFKPQRNINKVRREKDAFRSLLDDKSFVNENMDSFIASQFEVNEDEPIDNYENDTGTNSTTEEQKRINKLEATLIAMYASDPTVFSRSQRGTKERSRLRAKLELTDEQIEGWSLMFERNPSKHIKLRDHSLGLI